MRALGLLWKRMLQPSAAVLAILACSLATPVVAQDAAPPEAQQQIQAPADAPIAPPLPDAAGPPAASAAATPAGPQFTVAVIGDSLGVLAGEGLTQAYVDNSAIAIVTKARGSTGLVRDDFYDWIKAAHDLASAKDRPDIVVVLLGINDLQPLRDGATALDPLTDKWREIYGQRIEKLVEPLAAAHLRVLWVGLPPMRNDRFNAQAVTLNELYKEHAEKAGAKYIDIWDAFADQNGDYDSFGPDVNGQNVRLRGVDGIHFTKAGARKLAQFLDAEIMRGFGKARPPQEMAALPPDIEQAPIDISAQIRREAGAAAPQPGAPTAPQKPAAGPIFSLTGQPTSPGGALLTKATTAPETPELRAILTGSATPTPKPGRADDFSWPRH